MNPSSSGLTAPSHAWHFPTSPRSPSKLKPELEILRELDGQIYNRELQRRYAQLLNESESFEGEARNDADFSGRDRLRGPKQMGLVIVPFRADSGASFKISEVGWRLLASEDDQPEALFQRQVAKVQFPSPLHRQSHYQSMNVRPLTQVIALLQDATSLTKEEFALFANTATDSYKLESNKQQLRDLRAARNEVEAGLARREVFDSFRRAKLLEIYQEDIVAGRSELREGGTNFINTKWRTLQDYADSSIRYLRATGLITLSPGGRRVQLAEGKRAEALFLLETYGTQTDQHSNEPYIDYVTEYLGEPDSLKIFRDEPSRLEKTFHDLLSRVDKNAPEPSASRLSKAFTEDPSMSSRVDLLQRLEALIQAQGLQRNIEEIIESRETKLAEVVDMFFAINDRNSDVLDRPLMFEWNSWRALHLINDAKHIQGNFRADYDGAPLSTAPGRVPDSIVEYESFWLILEVTISTGMNQHEQEGYSITRHVGQFLRNKIEEGDTRPVYGLFLANRLNEDLAVYLHSRSWLPTSLYGGVIQILPVETREFISFLSKATKDKAFAHQDFRAIFEKAFSNTWAQKDSSLWRNEVASLLTVG